MLIWLFRGLFFEMILVGKVFVRFFDFLLVFLLDGCTNCICV